MHAVRGAIRFLLSVAVLVSSLGPLPGVPLPVAQAQPAPPPTQTDRGQPAAVEVSITAGGFSPPCSTSTPASRCTSPTPAPQAQTVTHDGASASGKVLFDSGEIPPGGGYSITLLAPGDHAFHSTTAALTGTLRVRATGLPGTPGDLARNRIPNLAFPRSHAADIRHTRGSAYSPRARASWSASPRPPRSPRPTPP